MRSIHKCLAATVLALALSRLVLAQTPLGTGFTYQRQLKDAGSPDIGLYDMHFRLYDATWGGTPFGPKICANARNVAHGLFTITLDHGEQFIGQERCLEIAIRADTGLNCASTSRFTTLAPRQRRTATSNALNADKLDGLDSTAFLHATQRRELSGGVLADPCFRSADFGAGGRADLGRSGGWFGFLVRPVAGLFGAAAWVEIGDRGTELALEPVFSRSASPAAHRGANHPQRRRGRDQARRLGLHPQCERLSADVNGDELVDFFDIDPFVGLLGEACP